MTSSIILPGSKPLGHQLCDLIPLEVIETTVRQFPDGETYIRINHPISRGPLIVMDSLKQPNEKILPLLFIAQKAKEMGAYPLVLVAPYLAYMRQDREFLKGEAVTSRQFASMVSNHFDHLITIDPHLHRIKSLNEIYSISSQCLKSAAIIAQWIKSNVNQPLVLGPDMESKQWVKEIASLAEVPYSVFTKKRLGDKRVELELTDLSAYREHTPVLVDDIISTASTMIKAVKKLKLNLVNPPVCLGIHGIFSGNSYNLLQSSGAAVIITTNTIDHQSNGIDVAPLLAGGIQNYLASLSKQKR